MSKIPGLAKSLLDEFQDSGAKNLLEIALMLIEELENEYDPDPKDLILLESLYELHKNIEITKKQLKTFNHSSPPEFKKLNELYENLSEDGSCKKFFND